MGRQEDGLQSRVSHPIPEDHLTWSPLSLVACTFGDSLAQKGTHTGGPDTQPQFSLSVPQSLLGGLWTEGCLLGPFTRLFPQGSSPSYTTIKDQIPEYSNLNTKLPQFSLGVACHSPNQVLPIFLFQSWSRGTLAHLMAEHS